MPILSVLFYNTAEYIFVNDKVEKALKNQIIKGTFILSAAGIITRIIGFYYRIFLSKTIGANGMGLYQMIFPVFGLCYSFAVVGIQMAVSRYTAVKLGQRDTAGMYTVLKTGLCFSFILSLLSAASIFILSDEIALYILDDQRCSQLIKIMSLSIPIGAVHSCVSGYYLGKKRANVSAMSQLLEQLVRVGSVYILTMVIISSGNNISPAIAVWGLVFGEMASALICLCFIFSEKGFLTTHMKNIRKTFNDIFTMAYPISLNKIVVSILAAMEAVFIPLSLKKSGIDDNTAISIYGILMGMAMPFILFPSTITNSLAAMILPSVAESQSLGNFDIIGKTTSKVIKYCLSIGIFCSGYFYLYGRQLGVIFFDSADAGLYISTLAWICPFLYLTATLGSILNGMGKTKTTFIHAVCESIVKLLFIILAVPVYGIKGCLMGILFSHILCAGLHAYALYKHCHFHYDTFDFIIRPLFVTALSLGISLFFTYRISKVIASDIISLFISFVAGGILFGIYIILDLKKEKASGF